MSYLSIANFKYGLDTRRDFLTSQPGTLKELINAHINQGGEIEKRKAFVRQAISLSFGMQPTASGITVFGSAVTPGAYPYTFGTTIISYQRLQHPDGATTMTAILGSTAFAGNTWAIAQFFDGNVYGYYNGVLVVDFTAGVVLATQAGNNTTLATALTVLINATGTYTATSAGAVVSIFGPNGDAYSVTITKTSAIGTLVDQNQNAGIPGVSAIAAVGSFTVTNGSAAAGTNKITSVKVNNVEILNVAVDWITSNEQTAANLAAQINSFTSAPDYTAASNGSLVNIFAVTAGTGTNGFVVKVTAAGNICVGNCSFSITLASGKTSITTNTSVLANAIDLTNGGVAWNTSLSQTCADIATSIRTNGTAGSMTGYTAFSVGNSIYVSQLVTTSTDPTINVLVNVGTNGGVTGGASPALFVTLSPSNVYVTRGSVSQSLTDTCTAFTTGGVAPYTYVWSKVDPNDGQVVYPTNPNNYATTFFAAFTQKSKFIVTVTDAAGSVAVSPIVTAHGTFA